MKAETERTRATNETEARELFTKLSPEAQDEILSLLKTLVEKNNREQP